MSRRRPSDDERWARWAEHFDAVEQEVMTLFHTRWMWKTLTGMLDSSGVEQYTVVQNYFVRTYAATMCVGIRREVDRDARTTSLARCLQLLKDSPRSVTRQRFEHIVDETVDPAYQDSIRKGFDDFAPSGRDRVDPEVVAADLERMDTAAEPVRRYAIEVVAHRQRSNGEVEPATVTFREINDALDVVGDVTKKYYRLRHPGSVLGALTPTVGFNFLEMFRKPWWTESFTPPREWELG